MPESFYGQGLILEHMGKFEPFWKSLSGEYLLFYKKLWQKCRVGVIQWSRYWKEFILSWKKSTCKIMLTKLCWDASSISRVCICLDKSPISIWAPWRASVFCETCTCTSAIWQREREKGVIQEKVLPVNVFLNDLPLLGLNLPDFHASVWGLLHSSKPSSHS